MSKLDKTVGVFGALAAIAAGAFWLVSSLIEVPDNIDTIVGALQRIGHWNAAAAFSSVIASFCAAWMFYRTWRHKPWV